MRKSTSPRSIISITQPPSPAGVIAPAIVRPIVVSLLRREHLVGEDLARLGQPAGVERLEAVIDQAAQSAGSPVGR